MKEISTLVFFQGDLVILSRKHPTKEEKEGVLFGTIENICESHFRIFLSKKRKNVESQLWRIDKAANRVTFDRMQSALTSFSECDMSPEIKKILVGHGNVPSLCMEDPWGPSEKPSPKFNLNTFVCKLKLNEPQTEIITKVFNRRVALIQGLKNLFKTRSNV